MPDAPPLQSLAESLEEVVADFDKTRINPEQLATIAGHVRGIIDALGLDRNDPNLRDTHERVAMTK